MIITRYDSAAPVYFGIDEVAAALSHQGGPTILLDADEPRREGSRKT
jgi:hypothetical protein